jgi:hypothetical protein
MTTKRKAAARPEQRTVKVILAAPYEGWEATARAGFKARHWADLSSSDPDRILPVLSAIILEHNFPDEETGELAETIGDVDLDGLLAFINGLTEELGKLPPR